MDGYVQAMRDFGLDPATRVVASPLASTVALGARFFSEVLGKAPDTTAFFCCNDDLALGALFECHRRGVRVPGDMSIVGFNDLEFCAGAYPALTSVSTPRYEMGRRAAEIVLEIIRGSGERPVERRRLGVERQPVVDGAELGGRQAEARHLAEHAVGREHRAPSGDLADPPRDGRPGKLAIGRHGPAT